ncbi:MAG: hypothetical protein ACM3X6_06415 [Patescibacteria group bacterium]
MGDTFSVKLPAGLPLADIDAAAAARGLNRNQFVIDAIGLLAVLTPEFIQAVDHFAAGLRVPRATVIEAFTIRRLAELKAKATVHPRYSEALDEIMLSSRGAILGQELLATLTNQFAQRERDRLTRAERAKNPKQTATGAGIPPEADEDEIVTQGELDE